MANNRELSQFASFVEVGISSIGFTTSVGIGKTNPQFNLDVAGDINFTGTFYQGGTQFIASRWSATGSDIYRLSKVGINTSIVSSALTVNGDVSVSGVVTATTFIGALTGTATTTTNIPNLTGDITSVNSVTSIAAGVIVDADINASAGIVDTKLATISTALKVSNSATTATNANTASAIVARDASGNFSAGTITASLTGTATSTTNIPNLTGAITSNNTTTSLGSFTSSQLATALTDETGSGAAVFATSPVLVTPSLGIATATSINASGIITATQLSTGASGTGVNITTDTISGPATLTIDPAAVGDNTGAVRIKGDLYVDGTQFIVNSTTIELADFNVGIATTVGTNALLDGAGIGIGSTGIRKTLTWSNSSTALKSSEDFDVASGKVYRVDGNSVLSNNTLGSGILTSSLTSVGTLGSLSVGNVNSSGIITATTFVGNLTNTLTLATSGTGLSGSTTFNNSAASTFTVASNATNANTVSTIVARDASGNFSAGTITASLTGTATSTTNIPNLTGAITSVNTATSLGSFSSSNLATALTDETGSGSAVFATSPTLVTPVLGTPQSGTLTSCTGLPLTTGVTGTLPVANGGTGVTGSTGTGSVVLSTSPTLVTPILGTPQSGTLTSCSGLPVSTGISGLGANVATFLATPSSANLISAVTDETGTGALVFATSPTLVTPVLGDATATSIVVDSVVTINASGINATTGIVTATTFQSTSDINLKENIETVNNSLNIVSQLRGVTFDWKNTHQASIGVIAQEVEQILPELVSGGEIKTVNYNGIIGILVEAIKEQQIRIEKLENKLNVQ